MTSIADRVADKLLGGLWSMQLAMWPDSVWLTDEEANKEFKKRGHPNPNAFLYREPHPNSIFYVCGEGRVNFGLRFGPLPHQYFSF